MAQGVWCLRVDFDATVIRRDRHDSNVSGLGCSYKSHGINPNSALETQMEYFTTLFSLVQGLAIGSWVRWRVSDWKSNGHEPISRNTLAVGLSV